MVLFKLGAECEYNNSKFLKLIRKKRKYLWEFFQGLPILLILILIAY